MRFRSGTYQRCSRFFSALLGVATLLGIAGAASAQTVVERTRLGNLTEDITYVGSGPWAGNVALLDGHEVLALPASPKRPCDPASATSRRIIDLHPLPFRVGARGIAWLEEEEVFALVEPRFLESLFIVDPKGELRETRTIRYLNGYLPEHLEGLEEIPAGAAAWPGHLLLLAVDYSIPASRIEVLRRDGQVVQEILLPSPLGDAYLTGVTFLPPDRIALGNGFAEVWEVSLAGTILDGPHPVASPGGFVEGLATLPDGRIASEEGSSGELRFWGAGYAPAPPGLCSFRIEPGVLQPAALGWDDGGQRWLVLATDRAITGRQVWQMPDDYSALTAFADPVGAGLPRVRGITWMPDEGHLAAAHRAGPAALLIYDAGGVLIEQIALNLATPNGPGQPAGIGYSPASAEFYLSLSNHAGHLYVVSRAGSLLRTIDLSAMEPGGIQAVSAWVDRGETRLLVSWATGQSTILDDQGLLLHRIDHRGQLGMVSLADTEAVTSGPHAGTLAFIDGHDLLLLLVEPPR